MCFKWLNNTIYFCTSDNAKTGFGTTKLGCIYELIQKIEPEKPQLLNGVDPSGLEPLASALQKRRSTR